MKRFDSLISVIERHDSAPFYRFRFFPAPLSQITPLLSIVKTMKGGYTGHKSEGANMSKPKWILMPDGSIGSDDLDAILELQRRQAHGKLIVPRRPSVDKSEELEFLRKLKPLVGKTLSAEEMAPIVGAETQHGVGPRLRKYSNLLAARSIDWKEYIAVQKTATGSTSWTIKKGMD